MVLEALSNLRVTEKERIILHQSVFGLLRDLDKSHLRKEEIEVVDPVSGAIFSLIPLEVGEVKDSEASCYHLTIKSDEGDLSLPGSSMERIDEIIYTINREIDKCSIDVHSVLLEGIKDAFLGGKDAEFKPYGNDNYIFWDAIEDIGGNKNYLENIFHVDNWVGV